MAPELPPCVGLDCQGLLPSPHGDEGATVLDVDTRTDHATWGDIQGTGSCCHTYWLWEHVTPGREEPEPRTVGRTG